MQNTKSSRPARKAILIITLCVLLIICLTAVANLFTAYEVRIFATPGGLRVELEPRITIDDILQAPAPEPDHPLPPIYLPDDGVYYEDNYPVNDDIYSDMPVVTLGDGTTLELQPRPVYDEDEESPRLSFQEIYQKCSPSVVLIEVRLRFGTGSGTGVIMSENGYIITSTHVIEDARQVTVTLYDGTRYYAAIVGMDENTDIAVLLVDADDLIPAVFGRSDELLVGEEVAVIGNPLGHTHTMTTGIISALNRDVVYDGITMRLIQTNAAINEGTSGGPLINLYGQVVGITNMKLVGGGFFGSTIEGMGFAVPTAQIQPVVDSIIAHGRVVGRPALGVVVRNVDAAEAAEEGIEPGVYVQRVLADTDAYAQGLRIDDRIVAVNGTRITNSTELRDEVLTHIAGDTVTLTIARNGAELELRVRLMDAGLLEF
ncbi:MAG: S1C family serine protease [Oscillospiraceae bacterium]|nr:S1C family serine protease [Oscillospiraceae bacterium]